jgi:hypothetical protein
MEDEEELLRLLFSDDNKKLEDNSEVPDYSEDDDLNILFGESDEEKELYENTKVNYRDDENVGSLTNEELKKYSKYIPEGISGGSSREDIKEFAYDRQGDLNRLGSGVARFGVGAVTKLAETAGHIGAFVMQASNPLNIAEAITEDKNLFHIIVDKAGDNIISETAKSLEDAFKENYATVLTSKKYDEGTWLQKMNTSEFWATDAADGFAFAGSQIIMAALTGGFGNIATASTSRLAAQLSKLGVQNVAGAQRAIATIGRNALFSVGESMIEAHEVKKDLLSQGYSNEQAAAHAANVFGGNMALLMLTNNVQLGFIDDMIKPASKRAAISGIKRVGNELIDQTKDYKGFQKFIDSRTGRVAKNLALGTISEGFIEENLQLAIQNINSEFGEGGKTKTFLESLSEIPSEAVRNLSTDEGKLAIALGAIVSGPTSIVSGIRSKGKEDSYRQKILEEISKTHKAYTHQGSLYMQETYTENVKPKESVVFEENSNESKSGFGKVVFEDGSEKVYKTEDEFKEASVNGDTLNKVRTKLDEKGNPIVNDVLVSAILSSNKTLEKIDNLIAEAYDNKNHALHRILKAEKFTMLASEYFENGLGNEFIELLESYKNLNPELLSELGFNNKMFSETGEEVSVQSMMNSYISTAKQLQRKHDLIDKTTVNTSFKSAEVDGKKINPQSLFLMRKNELFKLAAREMAISKELDIVNRRIEDINRTGEESNIVSSLNTLKSSLSLLKEEINKVELNESLENKEDSLKELKEKELNLEKDISSFEELHKEELSSTVKDKSGIEKLLSSMSKQELKVEEIKKAELINSRDEINSNFNKILDPIKGQKYFIENFNTLFGKRKFSSGVMSAIQFLSKSQKDYLEYESRRLSSFFIRKKVDIEREKLFSSFIKERLLEKPSISNLINDIIELELPLNKEALELIDNYYNSINFELSSKSDDLLSELEKTLSELKEEYSEALAEEDYPEIGRIGSQIKKVEDELSLAKEEASVFEKEIESNNLLYDKLKSLNLDKKSISDLSENKLKENIAEEIFLSNYKSVIQDYELDKEYSNLFEIDFSINTIEKFISIFKNRDGFSTFTKSLDDKLKKLKEIKKEIEVKLEDKDRVQSEIDLLNKINIYSSIGLILNEDGTITEDDFNLNILSLIKKIVPNYQEIIDKAKEKKFPAVYAEILKLYLKEYINSSPENLREFRVLFNENFNKLNDKLFERLNGLLPGNDVYSVYIENPDRILDYILSVGLRSPSYDISNPESSVNKFSKDKNISSLIKNIDIEIKNNPELKENREAIKSFIDLHLAYSNLFNLNKELNSEYDFIAQVAEEIKIAENKKTEFFPTVEQHIALRALSKFFSRKINNKVVFDNWAYLRGFAGTGKTKIVASWFSKILDIESNAENILSFGHTDSSSITITESVGSSRVVKKDDLMNGSLPDNIKVVIIDEIGAFNIEEIKLIGSLINNINKERSTKGLDLIKVLSLGDPNQKNINKGANPLDSFYSEAGFTSMTMINPLTVRYRSNVGSVVSFQDKFIDQSLDLVNISEPIIVRSNITIEELKNKEEEPLGVIGVKNFDKEIISILKSREEFQGTKALIVNTSEIPRYSKMLEDAGIVTVEVTDVYNIQGRTVDEVYVNILKTNEFKDDKEYNTDIYTATSRAVNFVLIGNINTKNETDLNLKDNTESSSEKIKNRNKDYKALLKEEYEALLSLATSEMIEKSGININKENNKDSQTLSQTPEDQTTEESDIESDEEGAEKEEEETSEETSITQSKEAKKADIIQTNEPTIQTIGNVTFGTANKQGQTDNNEDAVYVDTESGIFILADGMGGEGMITHSPSQTSQSVINKLLGKPNKNATEILYDEYLKNKNITSEEAVTFLNKNGFNIKGVGTSMVSTIINSFKTKGDLTNKKGFRTGATALKAKKVGKNTYKIEKVGDTVYFVVDKNGKVIQSHGLSDVATTQGYMFSVRDGKPYVSSPKTDNFTVTLNEGETLVLATDFIETGKAIQDFIDSDFGRNLNFAEFQKNNKSDDSTFITIKYNAELKELEESTLTQSTEAKDTVIENEDDNEFNLNEEDYTEENLDTESSYDSENPNSSEKDDDSINDDISEDYKFNHEIEYPTGSAIQKSFNLDREEIENSSLNVGDTVYAVKHYHEGSPVFTLIKRVKKLDDNGNFLFKKVGILTIEEVTSNFPEDIVSNLNKKLKDDSTFSFDEFYEESQDGNLFISNDDNLNNAIAETFIITKQPTKLNYVYGENKAVLSKNNFEKIIKLFRSKLLKKNQKVDYKFRIFSTKEINDIRKKHGLILQKGVPYIYIHSKRSGVRSMKPQFIRLNPRKLNNKVHKEYLAPLNEYLNLSSDLNIKLNGFIGLQIGDLNANKLIHLLGNNKIQEAYELAKSINSNLKINDFKNKDFIELSKKVYDLVYVKDVRTKIQNGDSVQHSKKEFTDKNGNLKSRKVERVEIEGDETYVYLKDDKTKYNSKDLVIKNLPKPGPAQVVFNDLAKSNLDIEGVVLRTNRVIFENGKKKSVTSGKSLLSTTPKYSENSQVAFQLREKNKKRNPEKDDISILSETSVQINNPISIENLRKVFSFNEVTGDSSVKNGFGIRMSVPMYDEGINMSSSKKNNRESGEVEMNLLDYYFETSLEDITRSSITISKDKNIIEEFSDSNETINNQSKKIDLDDLDDLRYKKLKNEDSIQNNLTEEEAFNFLKKRIPNATREQLKFVSDLYLTKLSKGDKAFGVWINGVILLNEEGGLNDRVLKHEIFHEIFNNYLSNKQKSELYNAAKDLYGNLTLLDLEEKLAENYEFFEDKSLIRRIIDSVLSLFGFYSKNQLTIDSYFRMIENGKFLNKFEGNINSDTPKFKLKIINIFGDFNIFEKSKRIYIKAIRDIQDDINSKSLDLETLKGVPLSNLEIIKEIYSRALLTYNNLKSKDSLNKREKEYSFALEKILERDTFIFLTKEFFPNINIKIPKGESLLSENMDLDENINSEQKLTDEDESNEAENKRNKGIYDHIVDSSTINPTSKASMAVKMMLYTIIDSKGNFVKNGHAFKLLADSLYNIDFNKNKQELFSDLTLAFGVNNLSLFKNAAVLNFLKNLINEAKKETSTSEYSKGTFTLNKDEYFKNLNTFILTLNDGSEFSIKKQKKEGTLAFLMRIKSESIRLNKPNKESLTKKNSFDINKIATLYKKADSSEKLSQLVTQIYSLRTKNPHKIVIPKKTSKFGATEYRLNKVIDRNSGSRNLNSFKTKLANVLKNNFKEIEEIISVSKTKRDQYKADYLNENLKKIKLISNNTNLNKNNVSIVENSLIFILQKYKDDKKSILEFSKLINKKTDDLNELDNLNFKEGSSEQELKTIDSIIDNIIEDSSSDIADIIDVLVINDENAVSSNYRSGEGKTIYLFTDSSNGHDNLSSLSKEYHRQTSISSKFLSYNLFLKERERVGEIIDHDSFVDEFTEKVELYKKENRDSWISRVFMSNFLNKIARASSLKEKKYTHQLWTISNKPNPVQVELSLMSDKGVNSEIKNSIRNAIIQEANRDGNLKNKNYKKNKDFSSLSGLEYTLSLNDISNNKKLEDAVNKVYDSLIKKSEKFLEYLSSSDNLRFSSLDLTRSYSKLKDSFSQHSINSLKNKIEKPKEQLSKEKLEEYYDSKIKEEIGSYGDFIDSSINRNIDKDYLRPFAQLFYLNNYLNGHYINQALIGDQAYFKPKSNNKGVNTFDIIKRMSIVFAVGKRGLFGDINKTKVNYKVAVGEDIKKTLPEKEFKKFQELFGLDYETTDGQGFMLPSRFDDLKSAFGESMSLKMTMKPVYWGVNEKGEPFGLKYSSIVLTDQLVNMFPSLKDLRDKMTEAKVDEYVFKSGVKVGSPETLSNVTVLKDGVYSHNINNDSIIELNSNNFRIQQQPYHNVADQSVATPSQLIYFLNSNSLNFEESNLVYNLLAEIMDDGKKIANIKLGLGYDNIIAKNRFIKELELIASKKDNKDISRSLDFLQMEDEKGNKIASLNSPFLTKNFIIQLSSMMSKLTTEIKFDGAKLVLQSAYGSEVVSDILNKNKLEKLKWRDKDGYAEVYLPDTYKDKINKGDIFLFDKMLGFRIPSTELHSAIPLKVKGYYPVTSDNENIIIAPEEITLFHGSDYDIDSLFVIKRSFSNKDYNYINKELLIKKGDFIGYDSTGKQNFNDFKEKINNKIKLIDKQIFEFYSSKNYIKVDELSKLKTNLIKLKQKAAQNEILETFLKVITSKKNEKSMNSPISLQRIKNMDGKYSDESVFEYLTRLLNVKSIEDIYPSRDLNDILDQADMHKDNFSGVELTGVFANHAKSIFYTFQAARNTDKNSKSVPILENPIAIGGDVYDKFSLTEKDNPNYTINENIDMLINSALDNVNEQILPFINATSNTGDAIMGMVALGVPLKTIALILNQPILHKLSSQKYVNYRNLNSILDSKIELLKKENKDFKEKDSFSISDFEKTISNYDNFDGKIENMSLNDLYIQKEILSIFEKTDNVGSYLSKISKGLKIVQQMPITYHEIETIEDNLNTKTIFKNVDYDSIPHIKKSKEILEELKLKINKFFFVNSKELINFVNSIKSKISLSDNSNESNEIIRFEFMKYLINGIEFNYNNKNISFRTNNDYFKLGEKEFFGKNAFNEKFIQDIINEKEKPENVNNTFLNNLTISKKDKTGNNYLNIINLNTFSEEEIERMIYDFESLNPDSEMYTDFQLNFLKYSVINNGLSFGSNNYNSLLPIKMYEPFFNSLDKKIDYLKSKTSIEDGIEYNDLLDNLKEHFEYQMLINKSNEIRVFSNKLISKIGGELIKDSNSYEDRGYDENSDKYYDLFIKSFIKEEESIEDNYKKYGQFILRNNGSVYYKLPFKNEDIVDGKLNVFYQKIGKKTGLNSYYQYDSKFESEKFILDNFIKQNQLVIPVKNHIPTENKKITLSYKINENKNVYLRSYDDMLRSEVYGYSIKKVEVSDDYTYTYTLESLSDEVRFENKNEPGSFINISKEDLSEDILLNYGYSIEEASEFIKKFC